MDSIFNELVNNSLTYAEIGICKGNTVLKRCSKLKQSSQIHLFDFDDKVKKCKQFNKK